MNPKWYGHSYPSFEDLVRAAEDLECRVTSADTGEEAVFFPPDPERQEPPVIVLPVHVGHLRLCWLMAHELAHLVMHSGPKGPFTYRRDEQRAHRWAACALIPEDRIRMYGNASTDAMIAALSANFEDIPMKACQLRALAAEIASHRLRALKEVA